MLCRIVALALVTGLLAGPLFADNALELNEQGVERFQAGQLLPARDLFREARRLDPENPVIRQNLENCLVRLAQTALDEARFADAWTHFAEGEQLNPDRPLFPYGVALAHFRLEEWNRALSALDRALGLDADHAPSHELKGRILYQRNQNRRALQHLRRALELEPKRPGLAELVAKVEREAEIEESFGSDGSPHFTLLTKGENPESEILIRGLLEDAYLEVGARLGIWPDEPIAVILYSDKEFREATGLHQWVGGAYDGKIRLPVRGLDEQGPQAVRQLVYHEYTHAAVDTVARNVPAWLHEGLAQCMEDGSRQQVDRALGKALTAGALPSLASLEQSFTTVKSAEQVRLQYQVAFSFVAFLAARGGWTALSGVVEDLGRGEELGAALLNAYGYSLGELEAEWHRTLR